MPPLERQDVPMQKQQNIIGFFKTDRQELTITSVEQK